MFIRAKIGTLPAYPYKVMRKKKPPKVGDKLMLRGYGEFDWSDYPVRVTEIKQVDGHPLYFVERF